MFKPFHCKLLKCFESPTRNHTSNIPLRRIPRQPRNIQKRILALQALRVNLRDFHFRILRPLSIGNVVSKSIPNIPKSQHWSRDQVLDHHIFSLRGQGELFLWVQRQTTAAWAPLTIADANNLVNCWLYGGTAIICFKKTGPTLYVGIVQLVALFSKNHRMAIGLSLFQADLHKFVQALAEGIKAQVNPSYESHNPILNHHITVTVKLNKSHILMGQTISKKMTKI